MSDAATRIAEIRQENAGGDVSSRDIAWLCDMATALTLLYRAVETENFNRTANEMSTNLRAGMRGAKKALDG